MSLIVTSLPAYVEENHDSLLRKSVLGAESAKMFTLQTGVKTNTALNILNTSVIFQDGSGCGFSEQGTSTISQRTISAPIVKVNMNFCDKDLLNTCLQHEVRVAAGQKTLPFEEDFVNDILASINDATEKMVWQGDTTKIDNVLKWTDGVLKHLNADDGITVDAQKLTYQASDDIITVVDNVLLAIPTPVLKDAVIFMGYDMFRRYGIAMKNANLYHYDADGIDKGGFYYPGTNVRIKAVGGLDGTNDIVACNPANLYYGTDLQNDSEKFDFWYSKDNQEFRLAVEFGLGTQVAFPNECVISALGVGA